MCKFYKFYICAVFGVIIESFTVYLKNLCLMIFRAITAHQTPTVRAKNCRGFWCAGTDWKLTEHQPLLIWMFTSHLMETTPYRRKTRILEQDIHWLPITEVTCNSGVLLSSPEEIFVVRFYFKIYIFLEFLLSCELKVLLPHFEKRKAQWFSRASSHSRANVILFFVSLKTIFPNFLFSATEPVVQKFSIVLHIALSPETVDSEYLLQNFGSPPPLEAYFAKLLNRGLFIPLSTFLTGSFHLSVTQHMTTSPYHVPTLITGPLHKKV